MRWLEVRVLPEQRSNGEIMEETAQTPEESQEVVINVTSDDPLYLENIELEQGDLSVSVLETDKGFAIILTTSEGIVVVDLLDDSADAIARAMGLTEMFISSIPEEDSEESFEEEPF